MYEYGNVFPLWEKNAMPLVDPENAKSTEIYGADEDGIDRVTNVSNPTLTFYPASDRGPHPAVLVCPGGGYSILAWNHEGLDICSLLNINGFSCFLLKYRCPGLRDAAHADAARAMRYIRANAEKFKIDPKRVGAIGFSAGAHLAATISAPANEIPYPPADAIDALPYRPDFLALIYPAYLADPETLELKPEFKVTAETPPTFTIQAEDDACRPEMAISWFLALKKAGVKVEMHLWDQGGHGYGLLRTGNPISGWGTLAADWFRRQAGIR